MNAVTVFALSLTFLDFCAGIGSTRIALERLGATCVGFSEIDLKAEKTYRLFFGENETNFGDLMNIKPDELPDFDVMLGGFPCQTFSIMGQRAGMDDLRGQIILGLVSILQAKRPRFFILENVKGLLNHNDGQTIRDVVALLKTAGYDVQYQLMRSVDIGVPQMRERVFFVGIRSDVGFLDNPFSRIVQSKRLRPLEEFLIDRDPEFQLHLDSAKGRTFLNYLNNKYNAGRHDLGDYLKREYLVLDTRQSDLRIYEGVVPTLRTGRHGILYVRNGALRSLSGMEALLLQGFPLNYAMLAQSAIQNSALLSQAGNAMTIPVVESVASILLDSPVYKPRSRQVTARSFALAS